MIIYFFCIFFKQTLEVVFFSTIYQSWPLPFSLISRLIGCLGTEDRRRQFQLSRSFKTIFFSLSETTTLRTSEAYLRSHVLVLQTWRKLFKYQIFVHGNSETLCRSVGLRKQLILEKRSTSFFVCLVIKNDFNGATNLSGTTFNLNSRCFDKRKTQKNFQSVVEYSVHVFVQEKFPKSSIYD